MMMMMMTMVVTVAIAMMMTVHIHLCIAHVSSSSLRNMLMLAMYTPWCALLSIVAVQGATQQLKGPFSASPCAIAP